MTRPATGPALANGINPPTAPPPERRRRIIGVDAARGIALLGMIAIHALPPATETGQPTWAFTIFSGRASAAFAVLSGVGIAFMTGRARVRPGAAFGTVAALVVRALAIGAAGLALGYTDGTLAVVILPAFAVMSLLVIPLVFLPTWTVALTGIVVGIGGPVLSHILRPGLPQPAADNPTFGQFAADPLGVLTELAVTGEFPALPWLAYLCAGLVVGRLVMTSTTAALGLLTTGVLMVNAAWITSSTLLHRYGGLDRILAAQPDSGLTAEETMEVLVFGGDGTTPTSTWWWLAVNTSHTSTPLDLLGTTGSSIALLGAMLLLGNVTRPGWRRLIALVRTPLAAAGGMPLTLYIAHLVFIYSEYDTFAPMESYLLQVAGVLLLGFVARGTTGRGPLEALIAKLARVTRHSANWLWQMGPGRLTLAMTPVPTEVVPDTPAVVGDGPTETVDDGKDPGREVWAGSHRGTPMV